MYLATASSDRSAPHPNISSFDFWRNTYLLSVNATRRSIAVIKSPARKTMAQAPLLLGHDGRCDV
jgi:hypothetical protein